jgi:bacteriocin biosynthesis cyclodehydratase domain-containing protein
MIPTQNAGWFLNPCWKMAQMEGHLVINGGADEVYVVDEVAADAIDLLIEVCRRGDARRLSQDPRLGAAIRQLRRVGALVPQGVLNGERQSLAIRWQGKAVPALTETLASHGWHCHEEPPPGPPGSDRLPGRENQPTTQVLTLIVRTTASWSDFLSNYHQSPPAGVHLFIDLAYHHTLAVGPMVVLGQTACVACLGHRIVRRWGELSAPVDTAMLSRAAGVAALLADAAWLGPRLVERAITLDLRTLRTEASRVFMQPECPVCASFGNAEMALQAPLTLPWLTSEQGISDA